MIMTAKLKSIAFALFLFLFAAAVFSLPHVAVLATILAPGMDPTVAVPVTDKIVEELKTTKISERSGRAQDKESAYMMQKLRSLGYM